MDIDNGWEVDCQAHPVSTFAVLCLVAVLVAMATFLVFQFVLNRSSEISQPGAPNTAHRNRQTTAGVILVIVAVAVGFYLLDGLLADMSLGFTHDLPVGCH